MSKALGLQNSFLGKFFKSIFKGRASTFGWNLEKKQKLTKVAKKTNKQATQQVCSCYLFFVVCSLFFVVCSLFFDVCSLFLVLCCLFLVLWCLFLVLCSLMFVLGSLYKKHQTSKKKKKYQGKILPGGFGRGGSAQGLPQNPPDKKKS